MKTLWTVVLGFTRLSIPNKIDTALFVHAMMEGNEHFLEPTPELKRVYQTIEELNSLYIQGLNGSKEDTVRMYQKERDLAVLMKTLCNYVAIIALNNNEIGDAIINSAGLDFAQYGGRDKRRFAVENTRISGRLVCFAEVVTGAAYQWEKSTDGTNYNIITSSDRSKIIINGFEPGSKVYIRVAPVLKGEHYAYQGPAILYVT